MRSETNGGGFGANYIPTRVCNISELEKPQTRVCGRVSKVEQKRDPLQSLQPITHNTMQTLALEFKRTREPKIQKFRGGTSSCTLLRFKSWMQDIERAIKDRNLNNDEALQLVKEFSEGCARDNINFYLKVTDKPSVDGLFENLRQVLFVRRRQSADVGRIL